MYEENTHNKGSGAIAREGNVKQTLYTHTCNTMYITITCVPEHSY